MPGTQELTRRIKSIKSTRKITKAMQMVSAAKMRKSQSANSASRNYSQLAWELIGSLNVATSDIAILKQYPEAKKVGIVLITTNRGLVGSFNNNLINKLVALEKQEPEMTYEVYTLGKKGRDASLRLRQNMMAEFPKQDTTVPIENIYPISEMIAKLYESGQYQKIYLIYNHFVSTLTQTATAKQLLPFSRPADSNNSQKTDYLYEPSPKQVLEHLLPRIVESQIYQALLENDASEHSARMLMMKNATDAAGDLIDDLTLTFNQLRQNKITTELSEITAGKIALENS